ncbi:MAG TPA: hypothetical protein VFN79_03945 [Steroidobacteraceae bacterium]|nr:hypothetical protein [Steroidobacteraceae bacterium]
MRPVPWTRKLLLLIALAAAPVIAAAVPSTATVGAGPSRAHWMRIESLIETDYFQQNAAALRGLAATLGDGGARTPGAVAGSGGGKWRSYYGALLAYRLALLSHNDLARAWPYTDRCVDQLDRVLVIDTGSAEAMALQSACLALQSRLDPWRSPLAAPLSLMRIDKALRLAPDNPRVLLLGALAAGNRPRLFGGDARQEFSMMRRAVLAFERQSGQPRGLPGWGAADAFTDLAQEYLLRGNAVAARNVLERALLVAPDFSQARQLMAEIVSG